MVVVKNPEQYKLKGFRKAKNPKKKYDAILEHKTTKRLKHVPFGAKDYEHYKDSTPLKLYSSKDHKDPKRRASYRARHVGEDRRKYSSGYFSWKYLW